MADQKITQKENIVGRDQAGHDINYNSYYSESHTKTYMSRLIEKFKIEKENDIEFHDRIEKLKHYSTPLKKEEIVGLEEKLIKADYGYLVYFAKNTKEMFAKKLAIYEFY